MRAAEVSGAAGNEDLHRAVCGSLRRPRAPAADPSMICFCGCSSARRPALWSAPRADRSSASTTKPATHAAAATRASGASGRCSGRSATISASSRSSSTACSALYIISLIFTVAIGGDIMGIGQPARDAGAGRSSAAGARRSGRRTRVPLPPLVDGPQRRLAARQRAAHPLQHVVGPAAGPGNRGHLRPGPDGHHLHGRRRGRLHAQQLRRCLSARVSDPVPARRDADASAPRRRSSGCSARWCTTAAAAEARIIRSEALGYAVTLGIMGFIFPGVDNYAHVGGFVGGYLAGVWLDPLKQGAHGSPGAGRSLPGRHGARDPRVGGEVLSLLIP